MDRDEGLLRKALWDYLIGIDDRERAANDRARDVVKAHEAGWKLVATAVERGLREVAAAIRDHR